MGSGSPILIGVLLVWLLADAPLWAREKTDLVVLDNGTRLMVEIKSLDLGMLEAKTDEMGTVQIKWDRIVEITSRFHFDVEVVSGEKYDGFLEAGPEEGTMVVRDDGEPVTLELTRVVRIYPLEATFWRRIKGSLDIGYTLNSDNNLRQFTMGLDASYRTHRYNRYLYVDSYYSKQDDSKSTENNQGIFGVTRFLLHHPKWGTTGIAVAQQNSEQGLDLRVLAGGMIGRTLIQTNRSLFSISAGAVFNQERHSSEATAGFGPDMADPFVSDNSGWEGVIMIGLNTFRHEHPKLKSGVILMAFPGMTISDRFRLQFQGNVSYELFRSFTVGLSLSDSYDSHPPVGGVEKNSYSISATIGYDFS